VDASPASLARASDASFAPASTMPVGTSIASLEAHAAASTNPAQKSVEAEAFEIFIR
jgi:hypothetical protein